MPSIVVGIQNYSGFSENFDDLEEQVSYLTREGTKYGIYFVLTALTTNAVRYRMMQNFRQLLVLQLNDQSEYSGILGSVGGTYPAKMKGRGILKQDNVYEFQLAFASEQEPVMDYIRQYAKQLQQQWKEPGLSLIHISPLKMSIWFATLALGINSGAYVAEIVRAGIMAVDRGQMEAGRSLGLSKNVTMKKIVFPQAIKNILPALGNEAIVLFKETAIVGYVAVADLTFKAAAIRSRTMSPVPLLVIMVLYLLVVMLMTWGLRKMEKRLARSDYR